MDSGRAADGVSSECDLGSGGREGRDTQREREMEGGGRIGNTFIE